MCIRDSLGICLHGAVLFVECRLPDPDTKRVSLIDGLLPVFQSEALCIAQIGLVVVLSRLSILITVMLVALVVVFAWSQCRIRLVRRRLSTSGRGRAPWLFGSSSRSILLLDRLDSCQCGWLRCRSTADDRALPGNDMTRYSLG